MHFSLYRYASTASTYNKTQQQKSCLQYDLIWEPLVHETTTLPTELLGNMLVGDIQTDSR